MFSLRKGFAQIMKKPLFIIVFISIISIGVILMFKSCFENGYLYVGVWYSTPEEALKQESENTIDTDLSLTVKKLLIKQEIEDNIIMVFVSKNDTLVTTTFVTNEDGEYALHAWTEEENLDDPTEFVATGKKDQLLLIPYQHSGNTISGWCYSTVNPTINGKSPTTVETFEFEFQGEMRSLKFWLIDGISESENVVIDFQ